jgi:hypothetical protein
MQTLDESKSLQIMETKNLRLLLESNYGTITEFKRKLKIGSFNTALKKWRDPSQLKYSELITICKHAKINLSKFIVSGVDEELLEEVNNG